MIRSHVHELLCVLFRRRGLGDRASYARWPYPLCHPAGVKEVSASGHLSTNRAGDNRLPRFASIKYHARARFSWKKSCELSLFEESSHFYVG